MLKFPNVVCKKSAKEEAKVKEENNQGKDF